MNWLDIAFIIIIIWAVRSSGDGGLIGEGFSLGGLALGIVVASQHYRPLSHMLFGPNADNLSHAATLTLTLLAIVFAAGVFGRLVREALHLISFGWLDQLGGLALGSLKGLFTIEVILIIFARFPILNAEKVIQDSMIAGSLSQYAPMVISFLPPDFQALTRLVY